MSIRTQQVSIWHIMVTVIQNSYKLQDSEFDRKWKQLLPYKFIAGEKEKLIILKQHQ